MLGLAEARLRLGPAADGVHVFHQRREFLRRAAFFFYAEGLQHKHAGVAGQAQQFHLRRGGQPGRLQIRQRIPGGDGAQAVAGSGEALEQLGVGAVGAYCSGLRPSRMRRLRRWPTRRARRWPFSNASALLAANCLAGRHLAGHLIDPPHRLEHDLPTSTLAEIEQAADSLAPAEKQQLMLFLGARLRAERGRLPEPRQFSREQVQSWITADEAERQRFRAAR